MNLWIPMAKTLRFCCAHLARMPLGVKQNKTPRAVRVSVFASDAVMVEANFRPDMIQHFWRGGNSGRVFHTSSFRLP